MEEDFFNAADNKMQWDLRVFRAYLLGKHHIDIYAAKTEGNMPKWFKGIKFLYAAIEHLIEDKDKKKFNTEYNDLQNKFITLAQQYDTVYLGKTSDAKGYTMLENALLNMEMFLYNKLQETGAYGKSEAYDENEI